MCRNREETIVPQTVLMEISFRGIHIIDKKKKNVEFSQIQKWDNYFSSSNARRSTFSILCRTSHFVVRILNS